MSRAPEITRIEMLLFDIQVPNVGTDPAGAGVSFTPGPGAKQARFALRVETSAGIVGEYVPPRGRAKLVMAATEFVAHRLLGTNPLERERHYRAMRAATKHVGELGIGALDVALWDIAGKFHDASITTLLGGFRTRLPAYASTLHGDRHAGGLDSARAYADFAEHCYELGYRAYKMHGWGRGDPGEEIAMLRAVGDQVGGRMDLMYDASCNLPTLAEAIRVGKVCDDYGYFWLEDPYADGGISIHGHRKLKEFVRTPLLITEYIRNPETTTDIVAAGASDFARVDPDYDGGITGSWKAALAAEALGIDVEVHSCGPAMRHLMAALVRSNYYEINLVHPQMSNGWHLPVYADDYSDDLDAIDAAGTVPVPSGPGLGVSYDWEAIRATATDRVVIES